MRRMAWSAVLLAAVATPAMAQDPPAQAPVFKNVLDCRGVADAAARLACFDRTVGALDEAQQKKDIVVADKATIREARRGLFGFSLPRIRLFGGGGDDPGAPEAVDSIDAKIAGVGQGREGGWLLTLDNGARWQQVDGEYVNRPRAGQAVTIKRAAISGFMAKVEKGRGFRVRRLAE